MFMECLDEKKAEVIAYVESTPSENNFKNKPLINPDMIHNYQFDYLVIASTYEEDILSTLQEKDIPKDKILRMTWRALVNDEIGAQDTVMRAFYTFIPSSWMRRMLEKYSINSYRLSIVETNSKYAFWGNGLDYIAKCMLFDNTVYSQYEMDRFIILSKEYYSVKKGQYLLDCGCNIATTSVYLKDKLNDIKVVGFEAVPLNACISQYNAIINGFEDDIDIVNKGLSNAKGKCIIHLDMNNSGGNKVVDKAIDGDDVVEIEMTSIDEYIENKGMDFSRIGYVWMDVEGYEGFVLEGMVALLKDHKVPLFIEYNKDLLDEHNCYQKMIDVLTSNYSYYIEVKANVEERLIPIEEIISLNKSTNLFLVG